MKKQGERRYSSYSFTTSALDEGEWPASCPGQALAPGKGTPVPIGQKAGWAREPAWTQSLKEKSSCLCRGSNLDHPVVQPVARHSTDWATPAPGNILKCMLKCRVWCIVGSYDSRQGSTASSSEHGSETCCSIKDGYSFISYATNKLSRGICSQDLIMGQPFLLIRMCLSWSFINFLINRTSYKREVRETK
jgi:hypothetical protein